MMHKNQMRRNLLSTKNIEQVDIYTKGCIFSSIYCYETPTGDASNRRLLWKIFLYIAETKDSPENYNDSTEIEWLAVTSYS